MYQKTMTLSHEQHDSKPSGFLRLPKLRLHYVFAFFVCLSWHFSAQSCLAALSAPYLQVTTIQSRVVMAWEKVPGATSYTITFSSYPDGKLIKTVKTAKALYLSKMDPNMEYYVAVKASNKNEVSGSSKKWHIETDSGTYPLLSYAGLNFHGSTRYPSITMITNAPFKTVDGVRVDITNGTETRKNIELQPDVDSGEWGLSPDMGEYAEEGIWWISKVSIYCKDGSSSINYAESPYNEYYTFDAVTTSGRSYAQLTSGTLVAQDYATPQDGQNIFYIETFLNGSSQGTDTDTAVKLFQAPDLEHYIASNDDYQGLSARLKIPLVKGKTYYLVVYDRYGNGGAYSVQISKNGFYGSSTATVSTPDAYEPDGDATQATSIALNTIQDHSFTTIPKAFVSPLDEDWFVFVAP